MALFSSLWLNTAFSGGMAFSVVILITLCIEIFGGVLGGILASIPTTIVPASIGFALSAVTLVIGNDNNSTMVFENGSELLTPFFYYPSSNWWLMFQQDAFLYLFKSLYIIPTGMICNQIFLMCWKFIPPILPSKIPLLLRLCILTIISLFIWTILSSLVIVVHAYVVIPFLGIIGMAVSSLLSYVLMVLMGLIFSFHLPAPSTSPRKPVPWYMILSRGVLAALAIVAAILMGQIHPIVAGITSIFPAIFLTSMVSLWISQGEAVPLAAIGPLALGSGSVSLYCLVAMVAIPYFSIVSGVCFSWLVSIVFHTVPCYFYIKWRSGVAAKKAEKETKERTPLEKQLSPEGEQEGNEEVELMKSEKQV